MMEQVNERRRQGADIDCNLPGAECGHSSKTMRPSPTATLVSHSTCVVGTDRTARVMVSMLSFAPCELET